MIRTIFASCLLVIAVAGTAASAQTAAERRNSGCARDVTRYCRSRMGDGDMAVLACLKEHRTRLSKTCAKTLAEHGQ
ncbi:MAG TPA: hypothetical protein VHC94_09200 [Nitrobacter sp.]|jgi:hypothetical protein|nr:hypothetical protein [Nitrobacter sp.]